MIQNGNVLTMTEPTPVQRQGPRLKSVIYGPSIPSDPLVTVIPSILQKVLHFISVNPTNSSFSSMNLLNINHGTLIPNYFNDTRLLIHLAFLLYPQISGAGLENIALDYLSADEDEDVDIEILDEAPAVFQTPRRRRPKKVQENLDDSFLRRSSRLCQEERRIQRC